MEALKPCPTCGALPCDQVNATSQDPQPAAQPLTEGEPSEAEVERDWQTIETAPKSGEEILGWDGSLRFVVRWNIDRHCWWGCGCQQLPTHWTSLQKPPLAAKSKEEKK